MTTKKIIAIFFIISNSHFLYTQTMDENLWVTDGEVRTIALSPDESKIYIGGDFNYVGPNTGRGAAIDNNGNIIPGMPRVNGVIWSVIPDGLGGWYIGGEFSRVGFYLRNNIARIRADKTVDPDFNPDANGDVQALAKIGSTIYVGGWFTNIGGQPRNYIAALDASTGLATEWNPNADSYVYTIVISGLTMYVGGQFSNIGGQPRNRIAALDISTGLATSWNPNANGWVGTIAVSGSTVYVGGEFTTIGDSSRNYIAALNSVTGKATNWNPSADNNVLTIAVSDSKIYVGGEFTSIGDSLRYYIAAIDANTGKSTIWNPGANDDVNTIVISGSTIYAGGWFTNIGGQPRNYIAALDDSNGTPTNWIPNASYGVNTLTFSNSPSGLIFYAGGWFTSMGGITRNYIAELDALTGRPTDWNPNANLPVNTIALSGLQSDTIIYVGGEFSSIGGQLRNYIAALSSTTGLATDWNPSANFPVSTIVLSGSSSNLKIYVGGAFTNIGNQTRNYIAELHPVNGLATEWNPDANSYVETIAIYDTTVFVGGHFTNIGGLGRNYIAALSSTTGLATNWNPNANLPVYTIVLSQLTSGLTAFVGGQFLNIGTQPRNYIAAIDATTGLATNWDPNANLPVYTISILGSTVYAGGSFSIIGNRNRNRLAAIDANTADVNKWDPDVSDQIYTLATSPNNKKIYAGGVFNNILMGDACSNLVGLTDPYNPALPVKLELTPTEKFILYQNYPNPFNPITKIKFSIKDNELVKIGLYDILGREVSTLLNEIMTAGEYEIELDANKLNLTSGVYFYEMSSGTHRSVKKLILLK